MTLLVFGAVWVATWAACRYGLGRRGIARRVPVLSMLSLANGTRILWGDGRAECIGRGGVLPVRFVRGVSRWRIFAPLIATAAAFAVEGVVALCGGR